MPERIYEYRQMQQKKKKNRLNIKFQRTDIGVSKKTLGQKRLTTYQTEYYMIYVYIYILKKKKEEKN